MIAAAQAISGAVSWVFDLMMAPFATHPAWGMVFISAFSAVWALLLFKAVTSQSKLQDTRDKLFGHIYEMGLYQDHLGILARIQSDLARNNLRYLGLTLPALVALTIPMALTLGQLEGRYAQRPLLVGEETVLTINVTKAEIPGLQNITINPSDGLMVVAGPVRNTQAGTLSWRLQALNDGIHELRFYNGDNLIGSNKLQVGSGLPRLHDSSENTAIGILLYPGAPDLSSSKAVAGLQIQWPQRETRYLGFEMDWLVAFMVFSMVVGLLIKDLLKVSL